MAFALWGLGFDEFDGFEHRLSAPYFAEGRHHVSRLGGFASRPCTYVHPPKRLGQLEAVDLTADVILANLLCQASGNLP